MPHININIEDNTGAEYTGGESVVFIPGPLPIAAGKEDTNHCVYISTSQYDSLDTIVPITIKNDGQTTPVEDVGTVALIEACLSSGLDVIYCHVSSYARNNPLPTSLDFLKDKDTYNVKILTTGYFGIPLSKPEGSSGILQDRNSEKFEATWTSFSSLVALAANRKDCRVISGFDYYKDSVKISSNNTGKLTLLEGLTDGDGLALQISGLLNAEAPVVSNGEYGALLLPNLTSPITLNSSLSTGVLTITMPSIYPYLVDYGRCLQKGQGWLPIANSERGSVSALGVADLTVTKYNIDKNIIKDEEGTSFNGIVNLRPYGNVIWGDRTLLKLENTVKATAYLSLGLLICDVAKRAYQSAVRYTYESNNDITWFNFKTRVTELLDEMVAAGVLSTYKMRKQPSKEYNKITCKITLYPNLPVENFDIYINLENAEISTSGEEE